MTKSGNDFRSYGRAQFHGWVSNKRKRRAARIADLEYHIKRARTTHSAMEVATANDVSERAAKRAKNHEAHMIPGLEPRKIYGFPNSIITKMRYCDVLSLSGTTGAIATNAFRANSIFDPDSSGVGHQPLYHDTYAAIYDQYVVLGSKITVTFLSRTGAVCFLAGIVCDDDSTFSSTTSTRLEQNNSVTIGCGPVTSGCEVNTLTATFSPYEAFGVDATDDGSSSTSFGSNPTEEWFYGVWIQAADAGSTTVVDIKVEIEYTVKCSELKTPTQS